MKTLVALLATVAFGSTLVLAGAAPADAASKKPIVMVIKSSTHDRADLNWYSDSNYATLKNHSTPWVKEVSTAGYVHSIGATNFTGDQVTLTCVIKYKGKVVRQHTVSGTNVSVNCEFDR